MFVLKVQKASEKLAAQNLAGRCACVSMRRRGLEQGRLYASIVEFSWNAAEVAMVRASSKALAMASLLVCTASVGCTLFDCPGNSSGTAVAADDLQTLQKLQKISLWNFGKDICSAAYKQSEGAPVSYVNQRYRQAKKIADILGAPLPPLPPRSGNKLKDKIFANKYLVVDLKPFYAALDQKYGPTITNFAELSVRLGLLMGLYEPGNVEGQQISAYIKRIAPESGIPGRVYQPLVDAIDRGAPYDVVDKAITRMDADIKALYETK